MPATGTAYAGAEVEPHVAVDPQDPRHLIGAWQQDRWSDGGAHGLVAAVSHNGGATFAYSWPHFSICAGGTAANQGNYPMVQGAVLVVAVIYVGSNALIDRSYGFLDPRTRRARA